MVGTDAAHEYTAMGDAVNVAARMQSHAEPGTVLITAATHRFLAPIIEARDVGMLELKGKSEAVHAFAVIAFKSGAVSVRGLGAIRSPMVGRDTELERLDELFSVARAGQGRVACVLGEPGIGKSRLLGELRGRITTSEPTTQWVEGRCLSYGQGLPYHLVLDLVRSAIGVNASADEPEQREALERVLREVVPDDWEETFAHLGHLLSLRLAPEMQARLSALELEAMKRYVAAVVKLLRGLRARRPLVVVCDDLHWADPASSDMLTQALPLLADIPALCVLSSRAERDSDGWRLIGVAREFFGEALVEITLAPLSRDDSTELVANLLTIESLPAEAREVILAKSEGNPFFVEEVIRMLIDRGAIVREGERWIATNRVAGIEIPDTLQGLLLARIDRLPEESRRTLRVASVIGRQFGVAILERLLATSAP
jgi:predicted ATPase